MRNDIRVYNYYDDQPLITCMSQSKAYLDKKFANIHVDVDLTEVNTKLDNINVDLSETNTKIDKIDGELTNLPFKDISEQISESKSEIIEAIEDAKPCLCHVATKEDVCKAKCEIITKIKESKEEIINDIDEKFVDLNEIIK